MDLSTQNSIGSALLIAVSVPGEPVTTFSTYWKDLSVGGINYVGLGSLLSITDSRSDLRAAPQDLNVSISGLVSSNLARCFQLLYLLAKFLTCYFPSLNSIFCTSS
jgi:hypothetical protein